MTELLLAHGADRHARDKVAMRFSAPTRASRRCVLFQSGLTPLEWTSKRPGAWVSDLAKTT